MKQNALKIVESFEKAAPKRKRGSSSTSHYSENNVLWCHMTPLLACSTHLTCRVTDLFLQEEQHGVGAGAKGRAQVGGQLLVGRDVAR